jgi:1,4-alpha-glucan branching enzyme
MTARGTAMRRRHDLPFGVAAISAGIRFRLWAAEATRVSLVLESPHPNPPALAGEAVPGAGSLLPS